MSNIYPQHLIDYALSQVERYTLLMKQVPEGTTQYNNLKKLKMQYQHDHAFMIMADREEKALPKIKDILRHGDEEELLPYDAAIDYAKAYPLYPYPDYVIQMGKNEIEKSGLELSEHILLKWTIDQMHIEDHIWGAGKKPIENLVITRKAKYQALTEAVKRNQDKLIDMIVVHHLDNPNTTFIDVDFTQLDPVFGGFISDIWSKVRSLTLTPLDKLAISPVRDALNDATYKLLPSKHAERLSKLTDSSAKILAGKLSTRNITDVMKNSVKFGTGVSSDIRKEAVKGGKVVGEKTLETGKVVVETAAMTPKAIITPAKHGFKAAVNAADITADIAKATAKGDFSQLNKENIKALTKDGLKIITTPTAMTTQGLLHQVQGIRKMPVAGQAVGFVDHYSGGLISSTEGLASIPGDVNQGKAINIMARGVDALKIGIVVFSGGTAAAALTAVGSTMAATLIVEETPVKDSVVVSSMVSTGVGLYNGDAITKQIAIQATKELAKDVVKKKALAVVNKQAVKQAVKSGAINERDAYLASMAVDAGLQASTAESGKRMETLKHVATQNAKSNSGKMVLDVTTRVAPEVAEDNPETRSLFSMIGDGIAGVKIEKIMGKEAYKRATKIANKEIKKRTGKDITIQDLQEASTKNHTKNAARVVLDRAEKEAQTKIENEKRNAKQRVAEEEAKLQKVLAYADTDISKERAKEVYKKNVRQINNEMNNEIDQANNKVLAEVARMSKDYDNFSVSEQYAKMIGDTKGMSPIDKAKYWAKIKAETLRAGKKYGMKLGMFLLWKYGPKKNYDQDMMDWGDWNWGEYNDWMPPENFLYTSKKKTNKLLIGASLIAASYIIFKKDII